MSKQTKFAALSLGITIIGASLAVSNAATSIQPSGRYILTDRLLVDKLKLEPLFVHAESGTVLLRVTDSEREAIAAEAHELHRCGGYELISDVPLAASLNEARAFADGVFQELDKQAAKNQKVKTQSGGIGIPPMPPPVDADIQRAVGEVSEQNLRDTVTFLASYPSRDHKSNDAAQAILAFKSRIEDTLKNSKVPYTIDLISHQSTPMSSIRLTFKGTSKAGETVVAGAHIDSINASYFGSKVAPGADDNASGSANILEAARILSQGQAPNRTIEFYWYAGEEAGLLGSAEIAKDAKAAGKNIVGVLQLDMTLFPGDGEFNLGSMTDFTSQEMRDLLVQINRDYIGATIVEDKCGYGCSDHASWYRNGYPTLMPFEATMNTMNGKIHTENDVVSSTSSFRHSVMFSKIAVAFLMTLSR